MPVLCPTAAFDATAGNAEETAICDAIYGKYESGGGLAAAQCKNLARDYVAAARELEPPIVRELFEIMFDQQIASLRTQGATDAQIAELNSQKQAAIDNAVNNLQAQLTAFGDTEAALDNTALVLIQTMNRDGSASVSRDEFKSGFLAFVRGLIPQP